MVTARQSRYGWIPSLPDNRDYVLRLAATKLPDHIDLRGSFPKPYDQGNLGSCTANAIAGLLEYLRGVEGESDFIPSRLFIYYYERVIEGTVGSDAGAMLRDGIKVVAKQGAPNEKHWPYDIAKFTTKPTAKVIAEAVMFEAIQYQAVPQTATALMSALAAGHPVVFGFSVYESFESAEVARTGIVPYPKRGESMLGGHAVLLVGYDATKKVFICRNSWSEGWGQAGHFTIPFRYVTSKRLASDFWTITKTT
jgi:C1A family cysteine protease